MQVPGETAVGELGEIWWDTMRRGGLYLMVSLCRHHGVPDERAKDGLQGALFTLCTPDSRHKWGPHPPRAALDVAVDLGSWALACLDQVLWVRKGVIATGGLVVRRMQPRPSSPTPLLTLPR